MVQPWRRQLNDSAVSLCWGDSPLEADCCVVVAIMVSLCN
jgi:hypothetical protein